MGILRFAALAGLVGLTLAAFNSAPASAASVDTNVGCDGPTVEVCFPVCVTFPCPGYVCVHTSAGDVCRTLWV